MSRIEALVLKVGKRKWILREVETKTSENERDFSAQKPRTKFFWKPLNFEYFLQMIVVKTITLITPIYRIELGIKE